MPTDEDIWDRNAARAGVDAHDLRAMAATPGIAAVGISPFGKIVTRESLRTIRALNWAWRPDGTLVRGQK